MKKLHSDVVKECLAKIMEAVTDDVEWDFVMNVFPQPNGGMMIVACVMIYMKNPLLGQPDLINCGLIPDLSLLSSDEGLRDTVFGGLQALREKRAIILGQEPAQVNGSLILPG